MNLGFIIALIYFVILSFWVLTFFVYFIWATKPHFILPGTTPQIYITIMTNIHSILLRIFGILFIVVTVVIIVLFFIWLIFKSLPWPLNFLAEIPPLGELNQAGVFALFERIFSVILSFSLPHQKFSDIVKAVNAFLKKFLIKFLEKYNPPLAEKFKQTPDSKLPEPEKVDTTQPTYGYDPELVLKNKLSNIIDMQTQNCIANNTSHINPNMSSTDKLTLNLSNKMESVKCHFMSIEPKVKLNLLNKIL